MGVPNKKLKKLMVLSGITLGVYAVFRYLLPLVIPFFIALALAAGLKPWVETVQKRLAFTLWGRRFVLPPGLIGGVILLAGGICLGAGVWAGAGKLFKEGKLLLEELPGLVHQGDILLTEWCAKAETALHLSEGSMVELARRILKNLGSYGASRAMPYLMGSSKVWLEAAVKVMIFLVVVYFGTVLALQEGEQIHQYFSRSLFRREYGEMARILKVVGAAYGKTQLLILGITVGICTAGLFLLGNPYYGLLGVLVGLLDALPFIGTGTVLFPWALACFFGGHPGRGVGLLVIYGACYLVRQIMEAKLMGREAGLSPFLTLAAVYVGLRLFGILGVILGPLGFLIIRESVDA